MTKVEVVFAGYSKTGEAFSVDIVKDEFGFKRYRFDRSHKSPFYSMSIDDIKKEVKKEIDIEL